MVLCVLSFLLVTAINLQPVTMIRFVEQPETQHILIGNQANFTCRVEQATTVIWHAIFPNGTRVDSRDLGLRGDISFQMTSNHIITTLITVNSHLSWNNTIFRCVAHYHSFNPLSSASATLILYTSLRPLPPSQLKVTTITSSILLVSWSPTLMWELIDYYNISIARRGSSSFLLATSVEVTNITISDYSHPPCTEFEFNISAISREYGESNKSVIVGGFDSDIDDISQKLNVNMNVYFRSNGSPIVDVKIQLPTIVCSYQYVTVNYSVISEEGSELMFSELSTIQGADNITSSIQSGLLKDQNYTLKVMVASVGGSSFSSIFTSFDTYLRITPPSLTCLKSTNNNKDTFFYKLAIGTCLVVAILLIACLVLIAAVVCIYVHKRRNTKKVNINDSTSRVCNAMVHNPIYDGPVYESVQPKFDTLTSATKRAASISNTSSPDQRCDSQPSTPTSSEKSIRYVDPPTSVQASKTRSKSFLSHPSLPQGDNENIPRSTSVSVPVIKKTDSTGTSGSHHDENSTTEPISAVNPIVLRDVDEHYTVMSPAGALLGTDKWSELSPEDTDKYKE